MQLDTKYYYSNISRILHHMRLILLALIYICVNFSINDQHILFAYHKPLGILTFIVISISIIWRILNGFNHSDESTTLLAQVAHRLRNIVWFCIYLILVITPIMGLFSSFREINFFELFHLKGIYNLQFINDFIQSELKVTPLQFKHVISFFHELLAVWLIPILFGLHMLGIAVKYHVYKINVLAKMFQKF